jgi:hypothetical protein
MWLLFKNSIVLRIPFSSFPQKKSLSCAVTRGFSVNGKSHHFDNNLEWITIRLHSLHECHNFGYCFQILDVV